MRCGVNNVVPRDALTVSTLCAVGVADAGDSNSRIQNVKLGVWGLALRKPSLSALANDVALPGSPTVGKAGKLLLGRECRKTDCRTSSRWGPEAYESMTEGLLGRGCFDNVCQGMLPG